MDTIPALLHSNSNTYSDSSALRHKELGIWNTHSWSSFYNEVLTFIKAFQSIGVDSNSSVAIYGNNIPQLIFSIVAAQSIGAKVAPIHPESSGKEVQDILNKSSANFVVAEDQQHIDTFLEVEKSCKNIQKVVYIDDRGIKNYSNESLVHIDSILKGELSDQEFTNLIKNINGNSIAFSMYEEKDGEVYDLTHSGLISLAEKINQNNNITSKDTVLSYLPLSITSNLLFTFMLSMQSGLCLSMPESNQTVEKDLQEIGPSILYAPAFIYKHIITSISFRIESAKEKNYQRYMNHTSSLMDCYNKVSNNEGGVMTKLKMMYLMLTTFSPAKNVFGLSNVKHAFVSDGVLSKNTFDFFNSIGVKVQQSFGQAANSGCLSLQSPDNVSSSNCGKPIEGVDIKVGDDGEIIYKSPYAASSSGKSFANEWVNSGFVGELENDGSLKILGRKNYLQKSKNGKSYSPEFIENLITCSPFVKSSMVISDNNSQLSCLISIDPNSVNSWADRNNLRFTGYTELASKEEVYGLIKEHINKVNEALESELKIKTYALLHRTFMLGEVSKTMDLMRENITSNLGDLIASLDKNSSSCSLKDVDNNAYEINIAKV
ncbi:MAG: AMP-binding protein [Pseudomonadota bacterium]|nr:AMP-binding protein [Pseudomonadota bacterium]MEC9190477.1 AMP-binding protein [Pseudomonadota bacterium]